MPKPVRLSVCGVALLAAAGSALLVLPASRAEAATVTLPCTGNNATDLAALQGAITAADVAGGTIVLTAGCTYTLTTAFSGSDGFPQVTNTVVITGNGDTITRSGSNPFRFFDVAGSGDLTLSGLTLSNAGGVSGGTILGDGPVHLTTVNVLNSDSGGSDGGAIFSANVLTIVNSSIVGGSALSGHDGGAIASEGGALGVTPQLSISGSYFAGNTSGNDGGAIHTDNPTTVVNSTFTGNSSPKGGAIYDNGTGGTVAVVNSTISGNAASATNGGGGIANTDPATGFVLTNSIVSGNTNGNCGTAAGLTPVTDGGHNLEVGSTCGFTVSAVHTDPGLAAPAGNGGPTKTMAITTASSAYNVASLTVCASAQPGGAGGIDQRALPRRATGCDIGAFEVQPVVVTVTVPTTPAAGALGAGMLGGAALLLLGGGALAVRRRRAA